MNTPRVAIVHDSITFFGGAERLLEAFLRIWPDADVYTAAIAWEHLGANRERIRKMRARTSFVQHIPLLRRRPFLYRYLLPLVWRTFDLSGYDLVISSSGSQMSHMVSVPDTAKHIYYCSTPPRHLYGYETDTRWNGYGLLTAIARVLNRHLRMLDRRAAAKPGLIIANSHEVQRRIKTAYGRSSLLVPPPATLFPPAAPTRLSPGYFLSVSRLSRMKHIDLVIEACNRLGVPLVVAGTGPEFSRLQTMAGPTVSFVGSVDDATLHALYRDCGAVVCCANNEDYGIVPSEAMSLGKPVIAYRRGGYIDSVTRNTGVFFGSLTVNALVQAIGRFRRRRFSPTAIRLWARRFSFARFRENMRSATRMQMQKIR